MPTSLTFLGAARTVTGSCYLLQTGRIKFLVDCGMFQGAKTLKELNYGRFPFKPEEIDFVLLTHAHIDHSGLIPKLVKHGFSGPVYATQGSIDLLSCMLPDAGYIQELEVKQLNRRNMRRNRAAVAPIYTVRDAEESLQFFKAVSYTHWFAPADGIRVRYWNAGHILGSASIEIEIAADVKDGSNLRLLFSGDVGPGMEGFHPNPESPGDIDYLLCESTYGGRTRNVETQEERQAILAVEVNAALKNNGVLIIPAFAVERTQELLTDLVSLGREGRIPQVPIFLDSPLAIRVTQVFFEHAHELENADDFRTTVDASLLTTTESAAESMRIEKIKGSHIIISASGMCEAGRIRHHLKNHLWRSTSTVLLVGYQAGGTLGQILASGAKAVRIQGEEVRVKASIRQIDAYSGHADSKGLLDWIKERGRISRNLFLVHGEKEGMDAFEENLLAAGYQQSLIAKPSLDDTYDLEAESAILRPPPARRIAPDMVGQLDWHNDTSRLLLDISEALEKAADDRSRGVILRRLRRALADEEAGA